MWRTYPSIHPTIYGHFGFLYKKVDHIGVKLFKVQTYVSVLLISCGFALHGLCLLGLMRSWGNLFLRRQAKTPRVEATLFYWFYWLYYGGGGSLLNVDSTRIGPEIHQNLQSIFSFKNNYCRIYNLLGPTTEYMAKSTIYNKDITNQNHTTLPPKKIQVGYTLSCFRRTQFIRTSSLNFGDILWTVL